MHTAVALLSSYPIKILYRPWMCREGETLVGREDFFRQDMRRSHVGPQLVLEPLDEGTRHAAEGVELEAGVLHDAGSAGQLRSLYGFVFGDRFRVYFFG